jgi:hypothetical protein
MPMRSSNRAADDEDTDRAFVLTTQKSNRHGAKSPVVGLCFLGS